ncbi:hypothetical protein GV054_12445 [Marinomonas mediterranea]|nr:hypothetical protein [Marinomonas mediterranea]WCN13742.1 hypothetical protein GV054_12445 [Marinomonas mediterranea]WCN17797.1 hypothetical protein GV053_12490 [Marinomonas mediterranea MMB-1]
MRTTIMVDMLIFWDERESPISLQHFIERLRTELFGLGVDAHFIALANEHDPKNGRLKASMRGLLDYVVELGPKRLLCFGSHPSVLGRLIQPALKCSLHTNQLPMSMDKSSKKKVRLEPVARFLLGGDIWTSDNLSSNYIFCDSEDMSDESTAVGLVLEDDRFNLYESQLEKVGLTVSTFSKKNIFENYQTQLKHVGLLMISSEVDPDGKLIDIANALGKPVLLISEFGVALGVEDGVNGWVTYSATEQRLLQCLVNWKGMSSDARRVLSQYSKRHQSKRSGISKYFSQFDLKSHKELNSFQKIS